MPPQETPSKEGPDPIRVLISIIKPGWKTAFFLILPILGLMFAHFICYSDPPSTCINIIRLLLSAFTIAYIRVTIGQAYKKRFDIINSFQKNQPQFFTIIVILGGTLAILIPMIMNVTKLIGDSAPLTTALLGITGGIIAIFGYYKTHQKSELEKEQLETQKQKDARDHIRQLHGSYNDRFDKALVELHSNDVKAAYAAVPKLAKLADSWLDYEDLSNDEEELKKLKKKAKKEVQTIINILCKYIRTMPGEYTEKDLKDIANLSATDQDKLKNESEVRRLIFSEMSDRSSKATFENEKLSITPDVWSEFDFNFSRAPIFYPLNTLTIEKGVFTSAKFYGNADFRGTTFIRDAVFEGVQFSQEANFNKVTFNGKADFSAKGNKKTTFGGKATFNGVQFAQRANFNGVTFNEVTFNKETLLPVQGEEKTIFKGDATFEDTHFTQHVTFNEVTFDKVANFSTTIFGLGAQFKNAIFTENEPLFTAGLFKAKFSAAVDPSKYNFSVATNSQDIKRGTAELLNKSFEIPLGTILFDPVSGKESNPAERRKGSGKRRKPSSK